MSLHPEIERFMLAKIGETTLMPADLMQLGQAFLTATASTVILGHKSPAGTLDYTTDTPHLWTRFPRDFIAWTSGRTSLAPGCDERLTSFMTESGWMRHSLSGAADVLGGAA